MGQDLGTPQFNTPLSSTRHFPTRAVPYKSQNPSLQQVISTQLPQFHTYPSVPHKFVGFQQIRQFHTNPSVPQKSFSITQIRELHTDSSVPNESGCSTQIRLFQTNPSIPQKSVTSTRHVNKNLSLLHKFISSTQTSLIWSFFCQTDKSE